MKLSHEEMMNRAWKFIEDLNITEDIELYESDPDYYYYVEDVNLVRDAYYKDLEEEEFDYESNEEDLPEFFNRHGILTA